MPLRIGPEYRAWAVWLTAASMARGFVLDMMSRSTFMNPAEVFDFMANGGSYQPNPAKTFGCFLKFPFLRIGGQQ